MNTTCKARALGEGLARYPTSKTEGFRTGAQVDEGRGEQLGGRLDQSECEAGIVRGEDYCFEFNGKIREGKLHFRLHMEVGWARCRPRARRSLLC
jgi:hypothetical protein